MRIEQIEYLFATNKIFLEILLHLKKKNQFKHNLIFKFFRVHFIKQQFTLNMLIFFEIILDLCSKKKEK